MRLDKLLSHAGFGTRKLVKQLLKKKVVFVDNKVTVKSDLQVNPDLQKITVNGEVVRYEKYVYLMLHKPQNYLSATVDEMDNTVLELVPEKYSHLHLFPVGRLDKDTEGLLIITNDGELNHILTSPKKQIFKTYYAKISGEVLPEHISLFKEGVKLDDGYLTKPAKLEIIKSDTLSDVELSISEGKFHQVKRMFEALDMRVTYLKRIQMGDIVLDKRLPLGKIRALNAIELAYLMSLKK